MSDTPNTPDSGDDIDNIANDIVSQLKNTINNVNPKELSTQNLSKDELERYIIEKTSSLVDQTMYVVNNLKDYVAVGGADSKEITAFAEVVKATSAALESLNKIHGTNERNKTSVKLKKMDIEARQAIATQDNTTKLLLSREELMKELVNKSESIVDIVAKPVE